MEAERSFFFNQIPHSSTIFARANEVIISYPGQIASGRGGENRTPNIAKWVAIRRTFCGYKYVKMLHKIDTKLPLRAEG
jgi:hypothetical protein